MPIEVRNIKEGKTLKGEVSPIAEVRFRATGKALLKAILLKKVSNFKLVLDLERISTEYNFYLNDYFLKNSHKVVIPAGFNLEFIEVVKPDSVHISLDDYMIKPVDVIPNVTIKSAPGFILVGSMDYTPRVIELKGPKEIIQNVTQIETDEISVHDLRKKTELTVPLKFDYPRVVESSLRDIKVLANIQSIGERIISEVNVNVLNIPDELRVFVNPSTVSLTVTGGVDYISGIQPADIKVQIDFNKTWTKQKTYYEPKVSVPADVLSWHDLSPKSVELVVTRIRE